MIVKQIVVYATVILTVFACSEENLIPNYELISINSAITIEDIAFIDSLHGFLCGGIKDESGEIYATSDGGDTWTKVYDLDKKLYTIYIKNKDSIYVAGDSMTVITSFNSGLSWENIYTEKFKSFWYWDRANIRGMIVNDSGQFLAVARKYSSFGAIYSATGKELEGLRSVQTDYSLNALLEVDNSYFAAAYGAIINLDINGNYTYLSPHEDNFTDLCKIENKIFACGYNGSIYSFEKEASWNEQLKSNNRFELSRNNFLAIYFINESHGICCGEDGIIYETTDGGTKWEQKSVETDESLRCITCPTPNFYFIGSTKGTIYKCNITNPLLLSE